MEDLALALRMLYGVEHALRTEDFYSLSRFVRERAGHQIPSNRAVVGEQAFEIESGIIAGWYARCIDDDPLELFPYHWAEVGQPRARVVYGKGSGLPSVSLACETLGIDADEESLRALLDAIKQRGLKTKALLPLEEVEALARQVLEPAKARQP
jgi:isopropylmalate/homocitrate/citramalate synthase